MRSRDWITEELRKPLDLALVQQFHMSDGSVVNYMPPNALVDQANRIFGRDGWSFSVNVPDEQPIGVIVVMVRVEVMFPGAKAPVVRADVGTSILGDAPNAGYLAMSCAIFDGLSRALRTFGAQFGLGLTYHETDFT